MKQLLLHRSIGIGVVAAFAVVKAAAAAAVDNVVVDSASTWPPVVSIGERTTFEPSGDGSSSSRLRRTATKATAQTVPEKEKESADSYRVPAFDLLELHHLSPTSESTLRAVLADTGLLSISVARSPSAPAIRNVRRAALQDVVCSCWRGEADGTRSSSLSSSNTEHRRTVSGGVLTDETRRTTLATATIGVAPIPLEAASIISDSCPDPTVALQALEGLRDVVHGIAQEFIVALDKLLKPPRSGTNNNSTTATILPPRPALLYTSRGRSYHTIHDIVQAAHNLEHFHLYEKPSGGDDYNNGGCNDGDDDKKGSTETVLPIHTDAGLFLVFVPGMDCDHDDQQDDDSSSSSSLFVERSNGLVQGATFDPDTFGVLFGAGAEHWLHNMNPLHVRATRHAVRMRRGARRAWYGMMHMVPQDAILQDLPQRTFADLRQYLVHSQNRKYDGNEHDNEQENEESYVAIGCGSAPATDIGGNVRASSSLLLPRVARRRRLQMVDDASACDNVTNFFCWMSCLPIPNPPPLSSSASSLASSSLYCLDPRTLDVTNGNVTAAVRECTGVNGQLGALHNDICTGQWHDSVSDLPEAAMVKQNLLLGDDDNDNDDPAPTTQFCYGGTSMYMDGFHWLGNTCVIYLFPEWIVTTSKALVGACFGTFFVAMALEGIIRLRRCAVAALPTGTWRRLLVSATFYGLQLTMGYLVMLIVMTYSGPLFLSVVLGLMGGHVVFNADQAHSHDTSATAKSAATTTTPKGTIQTTTKLSSLGSTDDEHKQVEEPSSCCGPSADEGKNQLLATPRGDDLVPEGCTPCCQNTL